VSDTVYPSPESTGIPQLDQILGGLYIGDNVIWYDDAGSLAPVFCLNLISASNARRTPVIYVSFDRSPKNLMDKLGRLSDSPTLTVMDGFTHGKGAGADVFLEYYMRRKTDAETLEVAVMVLAGEMNKRIVSELSRIGNRAVGICGADADAVRCVPVEGLPGYPPGIGFVGKPTNVNKSFFAILFNAGLTPVVSSIALGEDCRLYNINADQMASACASGTACSALVYLTDVPGVRDENGSVLSSIGESEIHSMRSRGVLSGGMLPKTSSCLEALAAGVESVHILPGSAPDVLTRFVNGTLKEGTSIHGKN